MVGCRAAYPEHSKLLVVVHVSLDQVLQEFERSNC